MIYRIKNWDDHQNIVLRHLKYQNCPEVSPPKTPIFVPTSDFGPFWNPNKPLPTHLHADARRLNTWLACLPPPILEPQEDDIHDNPVYLDKAGKNKTQENLHSEKCHAAGGQNLFKGSRRQQICREPPTKWEQEPSKDHMNQTVHTTHPMVKPIQTNPHNRAVLLANSKLDPSEVIKQREYVVKILSEVCESSKKLSHWLLSTLDTINCYVEFVIAHEAPSTIERPCCT